MAVAGKVTAGWESDVASSKGTTHELHESCTSFPFIRSLGRVRSSGGGSVGRHMGWHLRCLVESIARGPMLVRREMVRLMRAGRKLGLLREVSTVLGH